MLLSNLERAVEDCQADLAVAERQLESLERAPYEGRMADPDGWQRSLEEQRLRVRQIRGECALLADLAVIEGGA